MYLEMIIFVLLSIVSNAMADDSLRRKLRSPQAFQQHYIDFKAKNELKYKRSEDPMRYRIFRRNAELVADLNENRHQSVIYEQNVFSTLTNVEKRDFFGSNMTKQEEDESIRNFETRSTSEAPAQKLWTNEGAVTLVQEQGYCGSCWAFAAVAVLEGRYKIASGVLRKFSEQQYIDCVYKGTAEVNGCRGGWKDRCFTHSKEICGIHSAAADYSYIGKLGTCREFEKPNAMKAMKIKGYKTIPYSEEANIAALAEGPITVVIKVTPSIEAYKKGILKHNHCFKGIPDHSVAAVGYTQDYVLVKNSWGIKWGEFGFIRFRRKHDNCGLFVSSSYPILESTNKQDKSPNDPETNYRASTAPEPEKEVEPIPEGQTLEPHPQCQDRNKCAKFIRYNLKYQVENTKDCKEILNYNPHLKELTKKYCPKTCGLCAPKTDKECPDGKMRCNDGYCKRIRLCDPEPESESESTPEPHPSCHDRDTCGVFNTFYNVTIDCKKFLKYNEDLKDDAQMHCPKSCGLCAPKTDEKCPDDTIRCNDAYCKRRDMCDPKPVPEPELPDNQPEPEPKPELPDNKSKPEPKSESNPVSHPYRCYDSDKCKSFLASRRVTNCIKYIKKLKGGKNNMFESYAKKYCPKLCNLCALKTDEDCPNRTIRCNNGECKNSYLC